MSVLLSIFLGLVQGIAEFLPISSSGHLSVLQNLIGLEYNEAEHMLFDVLLHLGTLGSVIVAYRKDIAAMIRETVAFFQGESDSTAKGGRLTPNARTTLFVVIGTLPLVLLLPFYSKIEQLYYNTWFIGFAFLITGGMLYAADKLAEGRKNNKTSTVLDAVIIGAAQAIAVIPGLSRSGSTISVGMARGLNRESAVQFSFLLSLPAVLGSNVISLFSALKDGVNWSLLPVYLIGVVFAFASGYFAIFLLKRLIQKNCFGRFAYYCWGVGFITIILSIVL